ncbi:hypothetical protein [Ferrovibrio sp.]|uniref:hypothetical protein n=1 Tax=Ferrovibrio sp. TaxID=1917215 RepID=UPI003D0FD12A
MADGDAPSADGLPFFAPEPPAPGAPVADTVPTRLEPGMPIMVQGKAVGSIGCFAIRLSDGKRMLLSCRHVLLGSAGTPVYHPDASPPGAHLKVIGMVAADGFLDQRGDAAAAQLNEERSGFWRSRYWPGRSLDFRDPSPNERVVKVGCITGRTEGIVGSAMMPLAEYHGIMCWKVSPLPGATNVLCDNGDSGAVWVAVSDGRIVGLHIYGRNSPGAAGYSQAMPIRTVFDLLKLRLPTAEELRPPPEPDPLIARAPDIAAGKAGNTGIA